MKIRKGGLSITAINQLLLFAVSLTLVSISHNVWATEIRWLTSQARQLSLITVDKGKELAKVGPTNGTGKSDATVKFPIKQKPTDQDEAQIVFLQALTEINKPDQNGKFQASAYSRAGWNSYPNWRLKEPDGWPRNIGIIGGPGYSALSSLSFTQTFTLKQTDSTTNPILSLEALTSPMIGVGQFLFNTSGDDYVNGVGYVQVTLGESLEPSLVNFEVPLEFSLQDRALTTALDYLKKTYLRILKAPTTTDDDLVKEGINTLNALISIAGDEKVPVGIETAPSFKLDSKKNVTLKYDQEYTLNYSMAFSVSQWDGMWGEFSRDKDGNPIQLSVSVSVVPVPELSTILLLGVGLVGIGLFSRKPRRKGETERVASTNSIF